MGRNEERSVFYACYGSNLLGSSFMDYMNHYRDDDEMLVVDDFESYQVRLLHNMYYASIREPRHGPAAFLDVDNPGFSLGRVYRLSYDQFTQLALLESRITEWRELPWDKMLQQRDTILDGDAFYGRITLLGKLAGTPVLTVTSPLSLEQQMDQGRLSVPYPRYSEYILKGMKETMMLRQRMVVGSEG